MYYQGRKVGVTGADGFIGSWLTHELESQGAIVVPIDGDIRDRRTFDAIDHSFSYLFHFAGPSSQVVFKNNPTQSIQTTIVGMMNAANAAKRHGVRFVYPSTGLLSGGETNEYARCKKVCEDFVIGKNMDAIGIRLFAAYGPHEAHKRDYASVPYLFIRDVLSGNRPVVFGDGSQARDFIFIEDAVKAILVLAELCRDDVVDVGSGESTSFNQLLEAISDGTNCEFNPAYVDVPTSYVKRTKADITTMRKFYDGQTPLSRGIKEIVDHFYAEQLV